MPRVLRFSPERTTIAPLAPRADARDVLVALRNPYVRWAVSSHGVPPWPTDFPVWATAHEVLADRVKNALQRFDEADPSWADYERLALEMSRWETLRGWGRFATTAASGSEQALAQGLMDQADKAYNAVCDRLKSSTAHHVLSQWTRPGHRGLSADEKQRLRSELSVWAGGQSPKERQALRRTQEIRTLMKRRASAKDRTKTIATGVLVTHAHALRRVPAVHLASAAAAAASRGQDGWLFLPNSWEAYHALNHASDRAIREALWRQENEVGFIADPTYGEIVERLCQVRHEVAVAEGCRSYAAYEMWGRAEESVRRMETFLSQGLKKIGPEARRAQRAMVAFFKESEGISTIEPWDQRYAQERWREAHRATLFDRRAFPYLPTLHQAVPELMSLGGWTMVERFDHGPATAPVIHWTMRHHDGRKAHLWVDVALHRDSDGGQSYAVRSTHLDPVTVIHLALDPHFEGFDHHGLTILAHEIGHALHELAMTKISPHHEAFPWDAVEVPSQLLAQYVFDQRVLRRWASPTAAPKVRTAAYWKRVFKPDPVALIDLQTLWYNAWLDLKVHSLTQPTDLEAFDRKARETFGLPPDRTVFNSLIWDSYNAGHYAYPWADCLVQHLVGNHPEGGADANAVGQAFVALQDHVLRRVGPLPFNRVWKQSQGATAWQCALAGRDAYLKQMVSTSRAARSGG